MDKNGKNKRIMIMFLLIFAFLQSTVLPVCALSTTVSGYSGEQKDVMQIKVADEEAEISDFTYEFPEEIFTEQKTPLKNPIDTGLKEYDVVPLYYQTDYPETLYGNETIATCGSSITALAMVASYLTDYQYLPDELAFYFGGRAETDMECMELAAEKLGLTYEKADGVDRVLLSLLEGKPVQAEEGGEEIPEGKVAIVLVNDQSAFTDSYHFLVLYGTTVDGKFLVHDPYKPNYELQELQQGYTEGFAPEMIRTGYECGWIFDKSEVPELIERYTQERESRYTGIELSYSEKQLLARVIWVEARDESAEGQQAVAEVVLNRMLSPDFPNTLKEVIFQEGQFRSVPYLSDAQFGLDQYEAIDNALYGPEVLPEDVFYFATTATNDNVWGTIGGHIFCYADTTETGEAE